MPIRPIEPTLKRLIAEILSIDVEQVKNESLFAEDLRADSLDTVDLIIAVEEEFNVAIEEREWEQIKTVQQLIDFIGQRA